MKNDINLEQYADDSSAIIQAMQDIQNTYNYISKDNLKKISQSTGVPYSYAYAIATFYKAFSLVEKGRYIIKVCEGTACHLKLSENISDEIQSYLGIGVDETTDDKLFTLETVNCIGACAMAPAMSINEKIYGHLTRKKVRDIIDRLREAQ
ncbi:MAG: NAD(P)H-dependent oxidoreductase subunit E [Desulfobacterales bacterium]|nr:NAD(P)H-dependent oxidoreductase subunit E [Desulfobacterales bacterium]MDD4073236.1 NAD(P)H-dependent oxidoreductase subunit E [Desulfobacterales bacterium]MDD4394031.1 NAD(P)H-dependent oxidoreductase subunit E [Desulfobacterales bacterium]